MLHAWVTTVDHKKIGLMYIGYALVFLVIAGLEAVVMRLQLAVPQNSLVSPQVFNRLFTMHGTTMVFFVGMPILFGFGNYLIPLMLGARDMAFPAPKRLQLLDSGIWRPAPVLQFSRWRRALWRRHRAGRGLVCLCSIDCEGLFSRP